MLRQAGRHLTSHDLPVPVLVAYRLSFATQTEADAANSFMTSASFAATMQQALNDSVELNAASYTVIVPGALPYDSQS